MKKTVLAPILLIMTVFAIAQKKSLDQSIGDRTFEQVKNTQGFYDNEVLQAVVENVGRKIEAYLPENDINFTYHLVDVIEPNAFATGGGYVFVTRGLLALLSTEDELACVMAHEISHVTENHVRKSVYRNVLPAILEIPGNLIGLVTPNLGHVINMPIEDLSNSINSSFDREQEKQADRLGMELAEKAGYEPSEFINILERLEETVGLLTGVKPTKNIFDDHPMTDKRVKLLRKQLSSRKSSEVTPTSILEKLDGLLIGQNAQQGIVQQNVFAHPVMDFVIEFPEGFSLENTPVALTGTTEDNKNFMILRSDPKNASIFKAAENYEYKYSSQANMEVLSNRELTINTFSATQVEMVETGKRGKTYYVSTWVELSNFGIIIQILGASTTSPWYDRILKSVETFSPLPWDIKKSIAEPVVRIAEGEDETMREFAIRKNPSVSKLIVVINQPTEDQNVLGDTLKYFEMRPFLR